MYVMWILYSVSVCLCVRVCYMYYRMDLSIPRLKFETEDYFDDDYELGQT